MITKRSEAHRKRLGGVEFVVISLVAWLLIGPRVPIVLIFGSSVRLEDAVVVLLIPVAVLGWRKSGTLRRTGIGWVTASAVIAALAGVVMHRVGLAPALLYALRPFEYWIVYPALLTVVGRDPARSHRLLTRLLAVVTVVQAVAALAQVVLGISFGFSKFSYERGSGLTAGPYELGALCAALACLWLARRRYGLMTLALAGLVLSASRISLVAFAVAAGWMLVAQSQAKRSKQADLVSSWASRQRAVLGVAVGCGILVVLLASGPAWYPVVAQGSIDRVETTSVLTSWRVAGEAASGIGPATTSDEYQLVAYSAFREQIEGASGAAQDTSNAIRFFRWHMLLDSFALSPTVGLGPSFGGPSVDGALLRILVETGVVGALAWIVLTRRLIRSSPTWLRATVVAFVVGSIFIDIPFAMRPMILMWTLVALAHAEGLARDDHLRAA